MKLVLHGKFADDYGPGATIEAGSVAELLEAFSRQVEFYADRLIADRPLARAIGFMTEEQLRAPADQDLEVHLVPAMRGGGGKFGQIILGAILIGAALLIPGGGVAALLAGKASTLAVGLAIAGATAMLSGVMMLFVKAPAMVKNSDPANSLYLAASDMTTVIGTPIPIRVGRVKCGGHALSLDVTANSLSYGNFPVSPT